MGWRVWREGPTRIVCRGQTDCVQVPELELVDMMVRWARQKNRKTDENLRHRQTS